MRIYRKLAKRTYFSHTFFSFFIVKYNAISPEQEGVIVQQNYLLIGDIIFTLYTAIYLKKITLTEIIPGRVIRK